MVDNQRLKMLALIALLLAQPSQTDWIALAKGGFVLPPGRDAGDMLVEMNR